MKHAHYKMLMLSIGARRAQMPSRTGRTYEVTDPEIIQASDEVRALWNNDCNFEAKFAALYSFNSKKFAKMDRKQKMLDEQKAEEEAAAQAKHERLIEEEYQHTLSKKASRINPERVVKNSKA